MWVLITVRETKKLMRAGGANTDFSFEGRVAEAILEDENLELRESVQATQDTPVLERLSAQQALETDVGPGENEQVEGLYFIKNHKN